MKEEQLKQYREQGLGYKRIASLMNVSVDTVKYHCRKLEKTTIQKNKDDGTTCKYCDKPLVQPPKKKRLKFCSTTCRQNWWSKNRNQTNGQVLSCTTCHKKFRGTQQANRKYCSHACYIKERFGGERNGK